MGRARRDLRWAGDQIAFHILTAHGLDDHAVRLHRLELAEGVILRLQCLDEGIAIAAEVFLDDIAQALIDVVIGDLEILFLERLDDQLTIDR